MIEFRFLNKNQRINKVTVKGHALFGEYGTDIVCASVSTALIVTANAIEVLGYKNDCQVKVEEGFFELKVINDHDIIQGLLENLKYTFNELEAQYHSYIKNQKEG